MKNVHIKQEPNQETLEEAAVKYRDLKLPDDLYDGFIAGAKWQQERMYSEEEVKKLIFKFSSDFDLKMGIEISLDDQNKWFEQFKKKQ